MHTSKRYKFWCTVTPLSKAIAMRLFILLPFIGFVLGIYTERHLKNSIAISLVDMLDGGACSLDAMVCPDGTSVGRIGELCEFAPCPGS